MVTQTQGNRKTNQFIAPQWAYGAGINPSPSPDLYPLILAARDDEEHARAVEEKSIGKVSREIVTGNRVHVCTVHGNVQRDV